MASKYVKKDLFSKFKEQTQQQVQSDQNRGPSNKWPNPTPLMDYKIRFLPDKTGSNVYKKYFYHMFQMGDKWQFSLCPKTFDFEAYCPVCAVAGKLYRTGNDADKKEAGRFKRKEKFAANIFVVNDPRDQDKDEDQKQSGKVKIFEFSTKLEAQIRSAILDSENGVGEDGFDPSENGVNFILKVTETKPGPDGKKWPDYSTSAFARNSSPIADSDEELDEIMANTIDLDEYVKAMTAKEDEIVEMLKEEQVYELIQEEYERILRKRSGKAQAEPARSVTAKPEPEEEAPKKAIPVEEEQEAPKEEKKPAPKKEEPKSKNSEDDELLAELMDM